MQKNLFALKHTLHKHAHLMFAGVVILGVLVVVVLMSVHYVLVYERDKALKAEIERTEQALKDAENANKDKARDQEIADLKQQLLDLKNEPRETKTVNNTVTYEAKDTTADIVAEWSPRVAHIECSWYDNAGELYAKGSGSATLINFTGIGIRAITSRHVVYYNGEFPRECNIELTDGTTYPVTVTDNIIIGVKQDWAYVSLATDATLSNVTKKPIRSCKSVNTGDKLLVLGYPKIGSKTGLTVTEGIMSGNDGDFYITSAKIDKGNSGGTAILVKDDCYLGIPAASVVGSIESLGRILKSSFVIN